MCGIGGFYRMADEPIEPWQIQLIANGLEYRGKDATGIALVDDKGRVEILKHHSPAWEFTASDAYKKWMAKHLTAHTMIALIHTRASTKGTPYKNENNHPMYSGPGGGVIIHNGMIQNDDALFTANKGKKGWKRSAETDSDVIRAFVDFHEGIDGGTVEDMNKLSGWAAIAAWHPGSPQSLLLMRDSNPLVIGATEKFFAFASDKRAIHSALKPWVKLHGIPMQRHAPDISFLPMPDQTAWIIGANGFQSHHRFQCNGYSGRGNRTYPKSCDWLPKKERQQAAAAETASSEEKKTAEEVTSDSGCKQQRASSDLALLPRYVICPGEKCNKLVELEENERGTRLEYLACTDCGTNLGTALGAEFTA